MPCPGGCGGHRAAGVGPSIAVTSTLEYEIHRPDGTVEGGFPNLTAAKEVMGKGDKAYATRRAV